MHALQEIHHFRTDSRTDFGRKLDNFPTDFGQIINFGQISDGTSPVQKILVGHYKIRPKFRPKIFIGGLRTESEQRTNPDFGYCSDEFRTDLLFFQRIWDGCCDFIWDRYPTD